jgi:SecD/SecF fusion protein
MHISRLRLVIYVVAILFGILTALPNVLPPRVLAAMPNFLPKDKVTLGLDLRGGSHLVLEVDSSGLVREHIQGLLGQARQQLRREKIPVTLRRTDTAVYVTLQSQADSNRALPLLRQLANPIGSMGSTDIEFSRPTPTQIVMTINRDGVRDRVNAATEQSLEVIRQRVDQVGVSEPTIQRVGADRILVQLPGLQDPARCAPCWARPPR